MYQGFFSSFNQAFYCDEPFSDVEGYEDSVCYGTVTAYDIRDGQTNAYGAYSFRNFDDLMYWNGNGTSESSHWMEYFIEYSGLGGQIGINWSNF